MASVYIRIKNNRFYLDMIVNRRHKWESLNMQLSADKATQKEQWHLAEMCRAKREMQLLSGQWNFDDSVSAKQSLISYLKNYAKGINGKSSLRSVKSLTSYIEKYARGNVQLSAVSAGWVEDFQNWLIKESGLKTSSINCYVKILHIALNKAVRDNILSHNPASNVKNVKVEITNKPTLTVDELKQLFNTPVKTPLANECKTAFLFACLTGLRSIDLATLKRNDIERRQGKNGVEMWINKRQVKTSRFVEIPLNAAAWALIKPSNVFPMADSFVFPLLAKSHNGTLPYIKRWVKAAGIEKNIGWHTARRTFATLNQENGVDEFTLMRLMGHTSVSMTAVYAKSENTKIEAVKSLENVFDSTENADKQA